MDKLQLLFDFAKAMGYNPEALSFEQGIELKAKIEAAMTSAMPMYPDASDVDKTIAFDVKF